MNAVTERAAEFDAWIAGNYHISAEIDGVKWFKIITSRPVSNK